MRSDSSLGSSRGAHAARRRGAVRRPRRAVIDLHLPERRPTGPRSYCSTAGSGRPSGTAAHPADGRGAAGARGSSWRRRSTAGRARWRLARTGDDVGHAVGRPAGAARRPGLAVDHHDAGRATPPAATSRCGWRRRACPLDRVVALAPVGDLVEALPARPRRRRRRDLVGDARSTRRTPPSGCARTRASRSSILHGTMTSRCRSRTRSGWAQDTRTSTCAIASSGVEHFRSDRPDVASVVACEVRAAVARSPSGPRPR